MHILITGATGLVGQGVLRECLRANDVARVVALGRHATGVQHPKLAELQCNDFANLDALVDQLAPFDACFYCAGAPPLGTSATEYRHVTLTLTLRVAEVFAQRNGNGKFIYISGAHAHPHSRIMVLRVKGETEQALMALPIATVMVRPGGIQPVDGVRSPHRSLELFYWFAGPVMGLAQRLLPGQLTTTANVGRAMLALAREQQPPPVVENADINRWAGNT
ncbi:MAG: NAD-dependent epimerase/dehydratase family protein [Rhodanobacter sp.]